MFVYTRYILASHIYSNILIQTHKMSTNFYMKILNVFNETMEDLQTICKNHAAKEKIIAKSMYQHQSHNQHVQQNSDSDASDSKCQKTKKIKKKKRQIPGMPKPPPNAFVLYLQQVKHQILKDTPGLSIAAVTSIASKQWKQTPEQQKLHYRNMHDANRQIYLKKKQEFIKEYNSTHEQGLDPKVYLKVNEAHKNVGQIPQKKSLQNGSNQRIPDVIDLLGSDIENESN